MNRTSIVPLSALMTLASCTSADAHRGLAEAPPPAVQKSAPSPYKTHLIRPDGSFLPTYSFRGRTYAQGDVGQRYLVRVSNPTPERVEAVVSVDGLDVIDGQSASTSKRGYLIEPYGWVDIDGFRVSQHQVAAFRFSSVGASYAGRKGQARNVGVIGAAFFPEAARPRVAVPPPVVPHHPGDVSDDSGTWYGSASQEAESSAPIGGPRSRSKGSMADRAEAAPSRRPGLGTEFGEYRHSGVTFVDFVRSHPTRPAAVQELRYNDASGLHALGILTAPRPAPDETWTRETATPFGEYARPPR